MVGFGSLQKKKMLQREGGVTGCIIMGQDPVVSLRPTATF
jgi:hypothetical protein